jgi:hypothetical protein
LPDGESEIFLREGLDRILLICPSGAFFSPSRRSYGVETSKPRSERVGVRKETLIKTRRRAAL